MNLFIRDGLIKTLDRAKQRLIMVKNYTNRRGVFLLPNSAGMTSVSLACLYNVFQLTISSFVSFLGKADRDMEKSIS